MNRSFIILFSLFITAACNVRRHKDEVLFTRMREADTGITFVNEIKDNEQLNIIRYLYYYNGGGVAVGDINNDGLPDIYFTANQGPNKLYLNEGNFRFRDITGQAGVSGSDNWTTGVTMADVNADGWLDIYVCEVGGFLHLKGRNRLYINNGDLTFTEKAEAYNLDFSGFATHASFFDYDRDGDLDVYLLNHSVHANYTFSDLFMRYAPDEKSGDRLMRNDNGRYVDVTTQAGILNGSLGYGLSVSVSDFNQDDWPDIYVCNDFRENDYLYINNRDGTFRQVIEKSMPHTSRFSMGSDAADINNDLLTDLISLDMLPDDEAIRKQSAGEDSYEVFQHKLSYGFHYQFSRNALQLNRGTDYQSNPLFSDIAAFAGVEATDWSWAALFADFDNDGKKDLFITNGILRRPNDLDYITYITERPTRNIPDAELIQKMPEGKVPDRIFKNTDGYRFSDMTGKWMDNLPTCTQGAAYADLDLDGDLDLVVNVQNQNATIYRNNTNTSTAHFLRIRLRGLEQNRYGIGAKVYVFTSGNAQLFELLPSRGWQSAVEPVIHVGLGATQIVDSLTIVWPDGLHQKIYQVSSNQILTINYSDAQPSAAKHPRKQEHLYVEVQLKGLQFTHTENNYSAISTEPLLPVMHTTAGPPVAVADINRDGTDDIFIGGASGQAAAVYLQQADGSFRLSEQPALAKDQDCEDTACLFFDANSDGYIDLLVAGGGHQFNNNDHRLAPRLYLNNGKGQFIKKLDAFRDVFTDASVIAATDLNSDGFTDIFIGGRVAAGTYGEIPKSFLLKNDGKGNFIDITPSALGTRTLGRINGAAWADVNADHLPDLIVAGHWMPITVFIQQQDGTFVNHTDQYGLQFTSGWWNELTVYDVNSDSLPDLIAGNAGLNSRFRCDANHPLKMYINDFDGNGAAEQILLYNVNNQPVPFLSRDQLIKQIPSLKRKFLFYSSYSKALLSDIFTPGQLESSEVLTASVLQSVILKNTGKGFEIVPLPAEAQFFPIYAITPAFEGTDWNEFLVAGNLTAVQPEVGFQDAGYGLVIQVDKNFNAKVIPLSSSGFWVTGEARDIKKLRSKGINNFVYIVSRNNSSLLTFKRN
ncbi:MAG: VCBS repeat-containing protein [Cyclobacteriaceae bacterium]|nr:VCBS repeat-containing protein [Cyclobacteriaceae bacterium]